MRAIAVLKRLPRIAAIVAFLIAGVVVLNGMLGPVIVLPFAIAPLCAGIGILRRRVWSAYGFATLFFAQLLLVPVIFLSTGTAVEHASRIVEIVFWLMLGVLFLFAGHSLAASGAPRGRPLPWIAIAALTTVPFFFFQTFRIPGESMEGTLLPGDSILAQTFPRPVPERGKLALFVSPSDPDLVLIKRVIAVPGDRIHIAGKTVILNGTALDEKYVLHDVDQHYGENFPTDSADPGCAEGYEMLLRQTVNGEVVVPSGQYFVLGDRREDSLDSRCWGFVRLDKFIGRPLVIYDSVDQTSEPASGQYQEWEGRRRWARMFKIL